ncbi:MAG TPA: hypothetical protein VLR90_07000, partial [Blastocatellia bacterium]|nr:hypothetical protein [Blastocatellia bacterium]
MLTARTRLLLVLAVVATFHAAKPWHSYGQEPSHLKGLTSVAVHVQVFGVYGQTVSTVRLEADVEERLRQAGIAIGPREAPRT